MNRSRPFFLALLLGLAARSAAAGEGLSDLVAKYHSTEGRHDDLGYESQRKALSDIADLGTDESRKALRGILADLRPGERRPLLLVLGALVRRGGKEEIDLAVQAAEQARDPSVLDALAPVLGGAMREETKTYLRGEALAQAAPPIKAQIARALGAMGDPAAIEPLLTTLRDQDVRVRTEALLALAALKADSAFPLMVVFTHSVDARLRDVAARALGALGNKRAVPALLRALEDAVPLVVESAADALARLEDASAITPLIDRLAAVLGKDLRLTDAIVRALDRLSGKSLGDDPEIWHAWWVEAQKQGPLVKSTDAPTTVSGPRYYGFPVRSSRIVFVVDVSRSMSWNERLETAQKELKQVLEHLPKTASFDIVSFSDAAASWKGKLVPANHENVEAAARFVEHLKPLSGTNIHDGIRLAMTDPAADTIYFLSDGTPSVGEIVDQDQLLAAIRDWNRWRRIRIHAIALLKGEPPGGFGMDENRDRAAAFLKHLAEENGGDFREVR